jgi:hypothetical protein
MKKVLALTFFFCVLSGLFSQEYGRGALLDNERYESLPRKALQISRAYTALPPSVSLKAYASTPGNQGRYGSCAAWATAYAARTIAESLALNRTNTTRINDNVFSPAFVHKNISNDPECISGTFIGDALDFIRHTGVPKMTAAERNMDFVHIPLDLYANERKYTIAGYATLYFSAAGGNAISKTAIVKKSLSEGKPVVVGIICPGSFNNPGKEVWYPPADTPFVLPDMISKYSHKAARIKTPDGLFSISARGPCCHRSLPRPAHIPRRRRESRAARPPLCSHAGRRWQDLYSLLCHASPYYWVDYRPPGAV